MSKFFEFYFNPKLKRDTSLETFCFSPADKKEEKLGNLYLVGELKNSLPKNKNLLKDLAEIIKNEYYALSPGETEESLKESLAKANQFLEKELKKENTTWLGNLNFFVFSLTPEQKPPQKFFQKLSWKLPFGSQQALNFLARFSKVGDLKVFLFRQEEIFNLGDTAGIRNSAIKIFSNIAEGKVSQGDKILVLGEELFKEFWENKIFENLKDIKKPKELKKLFKKNKEILKEFFGILLFIFVKKERKKIYLNLPKIPLPFSETYQKILPPSSFFRSLPFQEKLKKSFISILILIILLLLGYLIFQ